MNRMNLIILLDRLDQLIDSSPEIPLTGKSLVDADEALELIDKIRNALPEEVKRAEWLASEKDRVIQESQVEAERIVAQAEEYVSKLVSENEIIKKAKEEATKIIEKAQDEARAMEKGANEYAGDVLKNLQSALEKTLAVVKKGKEELS